jgi:hypothetical protein
VELRVCRTAFRAGRARWVELAADRSSRATGPPTMTSADCTVQQRRDNPLCCARRAIVRLRRVLRQFTSRDALLSLPGAAGALSLQTHDHRGDVWRRMTERAPGRSGRSAHRPGKGCIASTRLSRIQASTSPPSKRTWRPIFRKGIRRSFTKRRTKRSPTPSRSASAAMSNSCSLVVALIPPYGNRRRRSGESACPSPDALASRGPPHSVDTANDLDRPASRCRERWYRRRGANVCAVDRACGVYPNGLRRVNQPISPDRARPWSVIARHAMSVRRSGPGVPGAVRRRPRTAPQRDPNALLYSHLAGAL